MDKIIKSYLIPMTIAIAVACLMLEIIHLIFGIF